jgi:hypothetical protein
MSSNQRWLEFVVEQALDKGLTAPYADLVEDVRHVILHRILGDVERGGWHPRPVSRAARSQGACAGNARVGDTTYSGPLPSRVLGFLRERFSAHPAQVREFADHAYREGEYKPNAQRECITNYVNSFLLAPQTDETDGSICRHGVVFDGRMLP